VAGGVKKSLDSAAERSINRPVGQEILHLWAVRCEPSEATVLQSSFNYSRVLFRPIIPFGFKIEIYKFTKKTFALDSDA
jgi:hypothetical protein